MEPTADRLMPPKLILTAQRWTQQGFTHARGQAFDSAGKLLRAEELATLFDSLASDEAWLTTAAELNGCFSVVQADSTRMRACVDRLRTIPLFFAHLQEGIAVSDTAENVRALLPGAAIDRICASEFRLTGYVTGGETLIQNLHQIPAGHCLFDHSRGQPTHALRRYYAFRHGSFTSGGTEALVDALVKTHERVFRRLLHDVGERTIVVPLSGGYDSRLIVVMLRDLGCRNVLCYSYGIDGNWEAQISRELAAHLGFRWTMVPYSAPYWRAWSATFEFQRYFRSAGNLASVSHIQDWPAVHEMHRRGEIPKDAVFVPGHSGDFLAGSHIPKWYQSRAQLSRDDILRSLFHAHFSLWDWPTDGSEALRSAFIQRIERITGPVAASTPEEAAALFEYWDCQERQAKFIVNSVRVYESFGYEWRLPLFDAELMDFWSQVPLDYRVGRRLYFEFVRTRQKLPITPANRDHSAPVAMAIKTIDQWGMRPLAKRAQRALRRARWRRQYEGGELAWFAMIDRDQFRKLYTGSEIGHSFFALRYLSLLAQ